MQDVATNHLSLTKKEWLELNGQYARNIYFSHCQSVDFNNERSASLRYIENVTIDFVREKVAEGLTLETIRRRLNMPAQIFRHIKNLLNIE